MKVILLAGGFGTRISEESHLRPKPMIEIGELPILVHIMKIYATQGYKDFIVCAGYKQKVIKEFFANYQLYLNDIECDYSTGTHKIHNQCSIDWNVIVSNTGLQTQTGGRIKRVQKYVGNERFMLTYGDAVGNININAVLNSHIQSQKKATICVYNYGQSKGVVDVSNDGTVKSFREKANLDGDMINIGYMICEPDIFNYIDGDECNFEKDVLPKLASMGELNAYVHQGFWQCMDTLKEKEYLEKLYVSEKCPWKIWED